MVSTGVRAIFLIEPRACGHIDLAPDNRLNSGFQRFFIKMNDAIHRAVVCNGGSRLSELGRSRDEIPDAARAVQETVFTVDVQMHERHTDHRPFKHYAIILILPRVYFNSRFDTASLTALLTS